MIDSVVLKIKDFILFAPDEHFKGMKARALKGKFGIFGKFYTRYTDYPQKMKKQDKYFPQVSVMYNYRKIKGGKGEFNKDRFLLIQVSMPKLLFGVSLFDVSEKMLDLFVAVLIDRMKEINVELQPKAVKNAIVTRVDYSKILKIAQSYGRTAKIIKELANYDYKYRSEFTRKDFHHDDKEGSYIKFYNPSQSLTIYDKFEEISINGTTKLEQEIRKQYKAKGFKKGALRIELSLQTKQIVDLTLRKFSDTKKKDFTLEDVLKTEISKALLLKKYEEVYLKGFNGLMYLQKLKDTEIYKNLKANIPNLKDRALLYLLVHRVKQVGLKGTIEEVKKEFSPATVSRYKKHVEALLKSASAKKDKVNVISYLHNKLKRFTPVYPKNIDLILKTK